MRADLQEVKFTRSSIIVYRAMANILGLKEGDDLFCATLHDVNGTGTLYAANKTDVKGTFVDPIKMTFENRKKGLVDLVLAGGTGVLINDFILKNRDNGCTG